MTTQICIWPSGDDKPVCMLRYNHQEFARKAGLNFENGIDDLDEYFGSFIINPEIGPIKFLEYLNAPTSGITVYVDSLIKTSYAVKTIKQSFDLVDSDLRWVREIED
jgi:hypothetical protein